MLRRPIRFAFATACAVLSSVAATPALAGPDSVYTETFDTAWRIIRDTHYDPETNGVDWDAVRDELRPKAIEADSNAEVRAVLGEMLSRLGESHFSVIPADAADALPGEGVSVDAEGNAINDDGSGVNEERYGGGEHWLGLDVRVLGDQLVVTSVEPGGPAANAGVTPGWVISKIGARDVNQTIERLHEAEAGEVGIIAWQIFSELLSGPPESSGRLTLLNAADEPVTLRLNRVPRPGDMAKFGNLPPINTRLVYRWLEPGEMGTPEDKRIGYIRFNIFMVPVAPAFERAIHELREADGVIIDIRGNLGGIGALAVGMSRHLLDEKANLGTMQMRGATLNFNAVPARATSWGELVEPFDGRVAVITDGVSASTSEIFAGGLQAIGRAKVFGQRTAGMALPAMMDRLPNGDVLLHAIADYHDSSGRRLEKDGVPPDFPTELSRSDLLQGIDAPVQEAARWIAADPD
ncbi:MAG: S41 family peptidase [Phycisphaerales bacterium JB059]